MDQHSDSFAGDEELLDDELLDTTAECSSQNMTEDGMYEHFRFVAEHGQTLLRVDKFLVNLMPKASRNRIQQAADAGCLRANGKPVKSNYRVHPDDVITIVMDRPRYENEIVPQNIPLDIVYEDDTLLVVNKPAGLVVHPGHGNYDGTLVNALAYYFKDSDTYDVNDPRLGLVHRIDKDTSGLLVIAKTPDAKTHLGKQFFAKTTRREYIAVVWGIPDPQTGRIEGNIGRSVSDRLQMAVYPPDSEIGKHAVTHYKVIEPLTHVSVIRCVLETGRTHQIRAHMRHIGHPLFNDARYGGDKILRGNTSGAYRKFIQECFDTCPRQALHARTLGFKHPVTGEEMFFTAELPADMTNLISRWQDFTTK